jgi:TrwC relaxase
VVADIAKLTVGREEYYTRELATDHEQYLSGHGESPGRWYGAGATILGLQAEASVAGFRRMFEGRDPTTGELLGRPHGRNAVPAFDVVLRPTKSVSVLYGLGDPAIGRAVLAPITLAWPRRSVTWTSTLGPAAATPVSSTCPDAECWRSASTTGPPARVIRCCTPTWSSLTGFRERTAAGRPWTALDGRDLYRHRLAADTIYRATYQHELVRTLGVEWTPADTHGNRELQGMSEELIRGSPSAPARSTPSWTG